MMKKFVFSNLQSGCLAQLADGGKTAELIHTISELSIAQVETEEQEAVQEFIDCVSLLEKKAPEVLNKIIPLVIKKLVDAEDYNALIRLSKSKKYNQYFDDSVSAALQQYYKCVTIAEQTYKRVITKNGKDIEKFNLQAYNLIISYKDNMLFFYKNGKKYVVHKNINNLI